MLRVALRVAILCSAPRCGHARVRIALRLPHPRVTRVFLWPRGACLEASWTMLGATRGLVAHGREGRGLSGLGARLMCLTALVCHPSSRFLQR